MSPLSPLARGAAALAFLARCLRPGRSTVHIRVPAVFRWAAARRGTEGSVPHPGYIAPFWWGSL